MIPQKPIKSYIEIAERCLNNRWGKGPTILTDLGEGWDRNSPAHRWTLRWAKRNFKILKKMEWRQIYKLYKSVIESEESL